MWAVLNANDKSPSETARSDSTSPLQHSNSASTNTSASLPTSSLQKQKRARSQLSCTPCRQGKLKCNRSHDPACDQCIKRNRESQCLYVPPPVKHRAPQNVKGRIRQLETLVVDLMNQNRHHSANPKPAGANEHEDGEPGRQLAQSTRGPSSELTPPSDEEMRESPNQGQDSVPRSRRSPDEDVDSTTPLFGNMNISKNQISYVGDAHWGAILNSISDLKRELDDGDEAEESEPPLNQPQPEIMMNSWGSVPIVGTQPASATGLGFLLSNVQTHNVTKEQLIAAVPEKRVADRLLSLWFNSPDPFKPIIHAPTFQEEYRRFWKSPESTPTMWLGLLFAIMSLAASFGLRGVDTTSPTAQKVLDEVHNYHTLAAGAAVLADFTKPKAYTIECLIIYAAGLRSNDAFVNVWLMIGLIVRLALRMGYHRDACHYPAISAFEGEMRRRVWAIINMIDVLISFQLGLPSMVRTIQLDTRPPRNLLDRDFNPSSKTLPPGRSIHELTPSSYTRAKLRLVGIFAEAAELSHATVAPAYEAMMDLDRQLEEAKAAVPPLLQMPDISELVTDPAEQLMCRFNLDLLYLKTKTVLHRRYMLTPLNQLSAEEQHRGIGNSRKICIECALRVLQHHHTIYTASQSGGQLERVKWYMGSISTHDFLLAAMIVCLELSQQLSSEQWSSTPDYHPCPRRRALMDALEKSQKIWADTTNVRTPRANQFTGGSENTRGEHIFGETEKAARAMAVMLDKVKKQFGPPSNRAERLSNIKGDSASPLSSSAISSAEETTRTAVHGLPFHGVVSTHLWSGTPSIANDFPSNTEERDWRNTSAGFSNGLADQSRYDGQLEDMPPQVPTTATTSEDMDFTLIGDMLDVNTPLDWGLWDSEIAKGQQLQASTWAGPTDSDVMGDGFGIGDSGDMDLPLPTVLENAAGTVLTENLNNGVDGKQNPRQTQSWSTGVFPSQNGGDGYDSILNDVSFDMSNDMYDRRDGM